MRKIYIIITCLIMVLSVSSSQAFAKIKNVKDSFTGENIYQSTFVNEHGLLGTYQEEITLYKVLNKNGTSDSYYLSAGIKFLTGPGSAIISDTLDLKIGDQIYKLNQSGQKSQGYNITLVTYNLNQEHMATLLSTTEKDKVPPLSVRFSVNYGLVTLNVKEKIIKEWIDIARIKDIK
ncbi:hypothetical protein [Pelosinus sp. sgz500959]|uniref:hypothetical protein n=1 Tax=Pelosinus sp. sgz500959 TaxID=3242472 RepID=UPI003671D7C0